MKEAKWWAGLFAIFTYILFAIRSDLRFDTPLWPLIVCGCLTVLFIVLWLYDKFFRERRKG